MKKTLTLVVTISSLVVMGGCSCWEENQANHQISDLRSDNRSLNYLAWQIDNNEDLLNTLSSILVVRPPQSKGSEVVREVIRDRLELMGWAVKMETFSTPSPITGEMFTFTNVVGTLHPNRPRLLLLACHYDSKTIPSGFLGATDSAVPCAILLDLVSNLDHLLQEEEGEVSLQVVFFDGEEQLHENSLFGQDGLYGSKYMAGSLAWQQFVCAKGPWCQSGEATLMSRIDLMLLLDLVGGPFPEFRNTVVDQDTGECDPLWGELAYIEDKLVGEGARKMFFPTCETEDTVVDDHTPFLKQGLRRVLHVIPDKFPEVWHTMDDDWDHLDLPTVFMVNRIIRVFVAEYLHLTVTDMNE